MGLIQRVKEFFNMFRRYDINIHPSTQISRDVVPGMVVLKDKFVVLGPGLGIQDLVNDPANL